MVHSHNGILIGHEKNAVMRHAATQKNLKNIMFSVIRRHIRATLYGIDFK